jgi:hypothetical protein
MARKKKRRKISQKTVAKYRRAGVLKPRTYRALRRKGMSKQSSARISNAQRKKSRRKRKK